MALSLIDDWRHLRAGVRLLGHLVCAVAVVWMLLPDLPLAFVFALAIAVAWITNLFNFMDGSDGLAGGMALIGFGAYAVAAGGTHPMLGAAALAVCGRSRRLPVVQLSAGARVHGRCRFHSARFSRRGARPGGLACGPVAAVVSAGGVRSVHGRCQRHAGAPDRARRARLGSASQPLLSALDPQRLDPSPDRILGIRR